MTQLRLYSHSTAIRPRYDHSTTYVTTEPEADAEVVARGGCRGSGVEAPRNLTYFDYLTVELVLSSTRTCTFLQMVRKQEAQLMLTTGSTRLAVSRGQQT